jgi:hypothetical protein
MNKWLVVLLVFSLAVNIAAVGTLVYFAQREGPPRMGPGGPMNRPPHFEGDEPIPGGRGPGMPGEMHPEVKKLAKSYQDDLRPLSRELQMTRQHLMRLMDKKPALPDSIDIMLFRMNKLQGEMEKLTVQHLVAIRPFLEEEQWRNLTRMLQDRMQEPRMMRLGGPRQMP